MEAIRGEQGEIQVRLDTDSGTATQYMEDIEKINHSRLALLNARDQWEEASGSRVDDRVSVAVADIEYAALHIITDLQVRLGELQPAVSTAPVPEKTEVNHPTYGAGLMTARPAQTTGKRPSGGSRRSKKTSSSTALKLQLRTDEAALAINERFDKERSERSLRVINREAARAAEDAEIAAEDARRAEEGARRQREEVQRQKEKVEREIARKMEELEDENLEKAESNRRQREIIQAKNDIVESFEGSSIRTGSVVAGRG